MLKHIRVIDSVKLVDLLALELESASFVAFDTETTSLDWDRQIVGYSVATENGGWYVPINHAKTLFFEHENVEESVALQPVFDLFTNPEKTVIIHNAKFDIKVLRNHGLDPLDIEASIIDTLVISWLCRPARNHGLKSLVLEYFNYEMRSFKSFASWGGNRNIPIHEMAPYAIDDATLLLKLWKKLERKLAGEGDQLVKVFNELEMPIMFAIEEMEHTGCLVDIDYLRDLEPDLLADMEAQSLKLSGMIGRRAKINSSQWLSKTFVEHLGWWGRPHQKGKSGNYSTAKINLDKWSIGQFRGTTDSGKKVARIVKRWRKVEKLVSTYTVKLANFVASDGRLHTNFKQEGTRTGRFSCLAAGSMVTTFPGKVPIQSVQPGQFVWTHRGRWRRVLRAFGTGVQEVFSVKFSNGKVLACTSSHRFLQSNGNWKSVGSMYHECFKELDKERREYSESFGAVPQFEDIDSAASSRSIEDYFSECFLRSEEQNAYAREESSSFSPVLGVKNRVSESNVGEERVGAPQLERRMRGRVRLFDLPSGGQAKVCSSYRDGASIEHFCAAYGNGRSSYRWRQKEQYARQPGFGYKNGTPRYSLYAGKGQSFVEVKEIYPCGSTKVYDLTVEEDSSYLACGVFSHNSSKPNLQNQPREAHPDDIDPLPSIRQAFYAKDGFTIMVIDYSQIELRLAAHFTQDPVMLAVYRDPKGDIHQMTADKCGCRRTPAKTINFMVWYGGGYAKLEGMLDITEDEAKAWLYRFFAGFPGVKPWQHKIVALARKTGYVTTLIGRRRYLPNIRSKLGFERGKDERRAVNTKIQGSAGDIIKIAMRNLNAEFKRRGWFRKDVRIILQVHDELVFEVRKGMEGIIGPVCQEIMENCVQLMVPMIAKPGFGCNWAVAK